jgi:hypothetical protein
MASPFQGFYNASVTVTRAQVTRRPKGYQKTGTTTVLSGRGDLQESGRTLRRKQEAYESASAVFYADSGVTGVETGDDVAISHDDGRTLTGSVAATEPLHDALILDLEP